MAIQIVPILKALAPIVANTSSVVASLKSNTRSPDLEARAAALEDEAIKAGELLAETTLQLEALAKQMELQVAINRRNERRLVIASVSAGVAVLLAAISFFV